ncbi:hypothetical protein MUG87_01920 [Ectobacillus sp. JY-23]|uniref:hypothetical protein n=1 Tax=Ectobacillus sp. JY-23 TaxID=2933872 RepID=UPI001FF1E11F|nr:hypothetical protein [Ectobacillus sp. JY-23]UOY92925.1 hypothetical protein MUG87_01920 [Ectobacillus sp. JY-23]
MAVLSIMYGVICLLMAEWVHIRLARTLRQAGAPFELQHLPLFSIMLLSLYAILRLMVLSPSVSLCLKFGIIYSATGSLFLLFLFFIKILHYQTYIFLVNWLRSD